MHYQGNYGDSGGIQKALRERWDSRWFLKTLRTAGKGAEAFSTARGWGHRFE